jgi:pimeloyl-ACP methyl ester carboxylesterase
MTRTALDATTTYYQAQPGLRAFRLALGAIQRLWPALAVRAALRLFGTPLPPRWLQRQGAWGPAWQVESWPFEDASLTVYSPAQAQEGPLAVLVHGWGGHGRQMLPLAEALACEGLRPVILEMPAHGRSRGSVSNLPQFARAIEYAVARLAQHGQAVRVLAAHSLAANAAAYATSRGMAVERLVLVAPPASPRDYTRLFAHVFGLSEAIRARMQARIEAREGILMAQLEPARVGPRIGCPTLVVHDRGDSVNRFADGQAFAAAIAGARLVPTEGLGHRKLLKEPSVLQEIATFAR